MFVRRFDLPLHRDPMARYLGWIIGIVVFLAVLAMAATVLLDKLGQRWETGLSGSLTVQIAPDTPGGDMEPAAPLATRVAQAVDLLQGEAGIVAVEPLTAEATARLLEPWLGGTLPDELPVPALIDVTVADPAAVDLAALADRLAAAVPGARLETYDAWLADLRRLGTSARWAAVSAVALAGGAMVLIVVFAVRAGLAVHEPIIELLHLMGATDLYIARQFESFVFRLAAHGAVGGLVLAGLLLSLLLGRAGSAPTGLERDLAFLATDWLSLAAIPLAACLLAALTARVAVLRTLARLP